MNLWKEKANLQQIKDDLNNKLEERKIQDDKDYNALINEFEKSKAVFDEDIQSLEQIREDTKSR